ncbi:MAG: hypothetical protein H6835_14885 [Planctomycetes bacterium]|nr:hypothetical protein [Planctomycetota bacterium]
MLTTLLLGVPLAAQQRAPLQPPPPQLPEVVLAEGVDEVSVAAFGLGDGGVAAEREELRWHDEEGCVTPGGVRVVVRSVGVLLRFPSGRELLVAPDGVVHLRSGESAGNFPHGVELLLGDDSAVRVSLAQARKNRVRDVEVVHGRRALVPWRRGSAAQDEARTDRWAGARLACCGDGGDLYRPLALGPLVVLERVLVEEQRVDATPGERLVVLAQALRQSLQTMGRQHRDVDADVRRAVTAVAGVADRGDVILPVGAALPRAERERARWTCGGGFELQLDLDGPLAPRLALFAGRSPLPMVEWSLGTGAAAYLTNPKPDQLGKRWHGNGTRLPQVVPELQVREHLEELPRALAVLRRFAR